jgi:hypothetical protein
MTPSPRSASAPSVEFEATMMSAIRHFLAESEPRLFPEYGASEQHPTSPPPGASLERDALWIGQSAPESSRAHALPPLPAEAEIAGEPPHAPARSRAVLAWAALCVGIALAVAGSGAYAVVRSIGSVEEVAVKASAAQAEAQPASAAAPGTRAEIATVACQPSSNNRVWAACAKSHAR